MPTSTVSGFNMSELQYADTTTAWQDMGNLHTSVASRTTAHRISPYAAIAIDQAGDPGEVATIFEYGFSLPSTATITACTVSVYGSRESTGIMAGIIALTPSGDTQDAGFFGTGFTNCGRFYKDANAAALGIHDVSGLITYNVADPILSLLTPAVVNREGFGCIIQTIENSIIGDLSSVCLGGIEISLTYSYTEGNTNKLYKATSTGRLGPGYWKK